MNQIGCRRACTWRRLACIATPGVLLVWGLLHAQTEDEALRRSMRQIFGSMQVLLPASVSAERFRDPSQELQIRQALLRVANAAGSVGEHAGARDRGVRYLGRSLDREAQQTLELYDRGAFDSAQYSVLQMAEYCVACHTRGRASDSALSRGFVDAEVFEDLAPEERAQLQFATRQFQAGMETLESLLQSRELLAAEALEPIVNYLVVAIRVRADLDRAARTLHRFAERDDLWTFLRLDVEHWESALSALAPRADADTLSTAADVLDEARAVIRFPSDRRGLVHYIVASRILQRFIEANPDPRPELARAYYLLGIAESRLGQRYWLSLADFYLETAIRMAPSSRAALDAYALLEEDTVFGYGGGMRSDLPPDVLRWLDSLRDLVSRARADAP